MSLLLDALKKAELAKQAGKSEPISEADVDTSQDIGEATAPVVTRASLPKISSSLEILSPDMGSPQSPPPPAGAQSGPAPGLSPGLAPGLGLGLNPGLSLQEEESARTAPREPAYSDPEDFSRPVGEVEAERKAARQMFEAKEMEYNPRRPFYITVGVLIACGAGYGGYLWWQLQPHYVTTAAVSTAPPPAPSAGAGPAAAGAVPTASGAATTAPGASPTAPGAVSTAPGTPLAGAIPGSPAGSTPPDAASSSPGVAVQPGSAGATTPMAGNAVAAPAANGRGSAASRGPAPGPEASARRGAAPRRAPAAASADSGPEGTDAAQGLPRRAASRPRDLSPIVVSPSAQTIDPLVEQGYDSFQRGDLNGARANYEKILRRDPGNRDALLGLAAVEVRNHDFSMAQTHYLKLLELDPRNPYALAGMTALQGRADPVQSESRLNTLIAQQPEVPDLYFALGNELAGQARWAEAQAAYFKAYSLDAENPDFAFNLAVSLDHLHQPRQALDYYRRALALAGPRNAAFDAAQVSTRVRELSR